MVTPAPTLNVRPRPYRRFLTSAFHSRFVQASSVALVVALDSTFWISDKRNLWSWFPIGPAFLKIILLFFTSLYIFILHVATLNIGRTTTTSPFTTLRAKVLSISTPQIFFWYILSAWWFSEIYIWSSPVSAQLGWIAKGDISMPDRLNEKPIYLRAVLLALALVQSLKHLYFNYSSLHLPISAPLLPSAKDQNTHPLGTVSTKMQKASISILRNSLMTVFPMVVISPFYYTLLLRQTFWWVHLLLAKPFFNISRSDARPTGYPPCTPFVMGQALAVGYLLVLTWESTTFLFSTYLLQEPLKKGQPLSTASKDPNGTLVNGMKSKQDVVKTFAFWELSIIAQRFPERRKAIFTDIERPEGARWSQMLDLALEVVRGNCIRIEPPRPAATPQEDVMAQSVQSPRILPDVNKQPILMNPSKPRTAGKQVEAVIGTGLKRLGQSKEPWSPSVQKVKGLLEYARPPGTKDGFNRSLFDQWRTFLQSSPVRWFFKSTPERKINALLLGSPCGNAALTVDAIEGVTRMLVASLSEDVYGKAISGVPEAVRVFTRAINAVQSLLRQKERLDNTEIEEVMIVVQRLKAGLVELLSAFQLYLSDVGLGIGELNDAKRAAGNGDPEPEEEKRETANGSGRREEAPRRRKLFERRDPKSDTTGAARQQEGSRKAKERIDVPDLFYPCDGPSGEWHGINGRPDRRREMEMVR